MCKDNVGGGVGERNVIKLGLIIASINELDLLQSYEIIILFFTSNRFKFLNYTLA